MLMVASRRLWPAWAQKTKVIEIAVAGRKRNQATGPHIELDLIFYVAALLPTISCTIRPALHK